MRSKRDVTVGGSSALGAALYSMDLPKESIVHYASAIKANGFVLIGHGPKDQIDRAELMLDRLNPSYAFKFPRCNRLLYLMEKL